jgi:hypothetical protein
MARIAVFAAFSGAAAIAALGGCGTLTEAPNQRVLVQTVLDHREVAGAGCILQNDAGKWFVTTPARVAIRKSKGQLRVDCRLDNAAWADEKINSRQNSTLWGNVVLTAGIGILVDRNTGQGFDYPDVLTVEMKRFEEEAGQSGPDAGRAVY